MPLKTSEKIALKKKSANELVVYLQTGKFALADLEDLAASDAGFHNVLREALVLRDQLPDPNEGIEFEQLTAAVTNRVDDPDTEKALNDYFSKWDGRPYAAEHLAQARTYAERLRERKSWISLQERMAQAREGYASSGALPPGELITAMRNFIDVHGKLPAASDDVRQTLQWMQEIKNMYSRVVSDRWAALFGPDGKLRDIRELDNFLKTMPVDDSIRAKADDYAWEWVNRQSDILGAAETYDAMFLRRGRHSGSVARLRDSAAEWQMYSQLDIYSIINFLEANPNHPYAAVAGQRIQELKGEALAAMKANPTTIPVPEFRRMLESPYFTKEELMEASGLDEAMLQSNVYDYENVLASLPPLPNSESRYGSGLGEEGITDVVFFGIQSTGKTCVLSGLLRHNNLWFDQRRYSGDYGAILKDYSDHGIAVSGTPGDFVATIKAEVAKFDDKYTYKFNLFEMAGEAFRTGIAHGHDQYGRPVLSFEDMGVNAAEILRSGNRKVFFLLVDPTAEYLQAKQQTQALEAMIALMFGDDNGYNSNADIMDSVDGLHFIVTKCDTLPPGDPRETAHRKVTEILNLATREKLIQGCIRHKINVSTDPALNGHPRVFPFSLGKFTVGNMFRYDPTGSSTILRVICDYCPPERPGSFGRQIRSYFTKPIIG